MARLPKMLNDVPATTRERIDDVDLRAFADRLSQLVGDAVDQVEDRMPSRSRSTSRLKRMARSRGGEVAASAVAASVPLIAGYARRRAEERSLSRMQKLLRFMSRMVRRHPVLAGATVAGAALAGVGMARRGSGADEELLIEDGEQHRRETTASGFDLDEEVVRMEGEGGGTSATGTAGGQLPRHRRNGAAHDGQRAGTR